jgi:hypothetical protein
MLQQNSTQQQTNNPPTKMLQFWGEKKRETPTPKKKTKIAIFLLHQSIKEGSNQNPHKQEEGIKNSKTHNSENNPQLEIDKPQAKKKKKIINHKQKTTTTTTTKLADTNQEKSFQDTNPKGKTTKNTTIM